MICKGNFRGTLVNSYDGSNEEFDGYCVVVCENVEEWGALTEAMLNRLKYLKENNVAGSEYFDFTEEIKILEKMYNETA